MLLFKRCEMPDTCYVQEVVYWLAFGRVPEWFFFEDKGDARTIADCIMDDGGPVDYDTNGYSSLEFALSGVEVDFDRYSRVKNGLYQDPEEARAEIARYGSMRPADWLTDEEKAQLVSEGARWSEEIERQIPDLEWAEDIERRMEPVIDRARAAIFHALSLGKLKAVGWVYNKEYAGGDFTQAEDAKDCGEFKEIPPDAWTLRNFDWEQSELKTPFVTYMVVQIPTALMLTVFPEPTCGFAEMKVRAFCDVAIVDSLEHTKSDQGISNGGFRKRGRPPKAAGSIRDAVQNYFRDRLKKERLPRKEEALVEEVIEFVRITFEQSISRSTAQSYIAPLRMNVPEIVPEIQPNN